MESYRKGEDQRKKDEKSHLTTLSVSVKKMTQQGKRNDRHFCVMP